MKITINQCGLEVGPYTLEETQALLAAGILDAEDLARPEGGDDWAPLKDVVSQLTSGQPAPKGKASSTTSLISQVTPYPSAAKEKSPAPPTSPISLPAPRPSAAKDEAGSTTGAISQRRVTPLMARAKARSAASTASPRKDGPPASTDKVRSAASASPEPNPSKMNPAVVCCMVIGSILVLIPLLFAGFAPEKFAKLLEPSIPAGAVSIHLGPAVTKEGDLIAVTKATDSSRDQLRDEVLELIYSMAKDNPSANKMKLTLHVTGVLTPKDVVIAVDDLATVRTFSEQKAYAASDARKVVDGDLKAAGL